MQPARIYLKWRISDTVSCRKGLSKHLVKPQWDAAFNIERRHFGKSARRIDVAKTALSNIVG